MAFKDSVVFLYNGKIKIDYLDKSHRYYVSNREVWELPKEDEKAWGKKRRAKGVTTMMDDVLEKKGLLTWPMGLALGELFGFYNFKNDNGEQMIGFSKGKGTLWDHQDPDNDWLLEIKKEDLLPLVKSASEAHTRKKQKGADIGSVVHDALEHYVRGLPFNIGETYNASIAEAEYADPADKHRAEQEAPEDIKCAEVAFASFKTWWDSTKPELLGAEELLYSEQMDFCGTYDALLKIDGKQIRVDWKTSNASKSKAAAAPQGVYYSYFIQLGFYEAAAQEMGQPISDDLLCVSVRKDGGFDLVYASEIGLSVEWCIKAAKCVWFLRDFITTAKTGLNKGGAEKA